MKTLLTANLSTKLAEEGGSAWTPPALTYGEDLTLALRFAQSIDGTPVEPILDIQGLVASIGRIDERPESGGWALQIGSGPQTGDNTTGSLPHDATPKQVSDAIAAKAAIVTTYGAPTVTKEDGSWRIKMGTGPVEVPVKVVDNTLWPISFGRVSSLQLDEAWYTEVRLVQAPLAFTDISERILPPAPAITRVTAGGTNGGTIWNEIQELYVPPDFRATYQIRSGLYARTGELSIDDTAETIQEALEEIFGAGNVEVTNTRAFTARIELIGDLAGTTIDVMTITALNPPPGDLTFTLELDKAPLAAVLKRVSELIVPLEVRIRVADDDDVITEVVAIRQNVTVQRGLIVPELALVPEHDYLRPASPRTYKPFNAGNVIVAHQFYREPIGDGEETEFVIDHGLATEDFYVWVRENWTGGRLLVQGTDFIVDDLQSNSVTVTLLGEAPLENGLVVTVVSGQTVAQFANDLELEIGQVTGLSDQLDAIGVQLAAILALVPTNPLGITTTLSEGDPLLVEIPNTEGTLPRAAAVTAGKIDPTKLPRPGGLLPAIHDATVTDITTLPAVGASAGNVFKNTSSGALFLAGGFGSRSSSIPVNGFAGSDGRRFYPLTRKGTTNSYYPRDFERVLFSFSINAQMLRAGAKMQLEFKLALQLLQATSGAQYLVVIEHGTVAGQSSPATTSSNLEDIVWDATPLMSQRVILNANKITHRFGAQILRSSGGTVSANKVIYDLATAADSVPASADFALRARLINFDVENSVTDAVGTVFYALIDAQAVLTAPTT